MAANMQPPNVVAQKWANNLAAATPTIQAGVQAVQANPCTAAAAKVNEYLQGVQRAVSTGKWVRRLNAVSLNDWQTAMLSKGVPRIGAGATNARPKFEAFMTRWLPYMQQLKQNLRSQPRGDINQNIQRAVTAMQFAAAWPG